MLAVDLPSGWPADATAATVAAPVFPADAVITFTAPKPAHVFGQLTRRVGSAGGGGADRVAGGGDCFRAESCIGRASALALAQTPRAADANKGSFGHVLVVGGTFGSAGGKAGAPAMAALAALRVGAGLVTAAVPAPALAVVSAVAPELMTWPLEATRRGAISDENLAPDEWPR